MAFINDWLLFTIFFGLLLLVTIIMMKQSENFYTQDPIVRKFSIMELEIPAAPKELINLIKGLYNLPRRESQKAIKALKGQLKVDFLFMPLAYGSIFLLCWRVANKMQLDFGHFVFLGFAFLQVVPLVCDIIENIYLLGRIKRDIKGENEMDESEIQNEKKKHKRYLLMEAVKWGIALTATVCAISAVFYFWLTGNYSANSFIYFLIVLLEVLIFLAAVKFVVK